MNSEFELRGVNHVALVCSDMRRTVGFYSGVLGMPLIKTIEWALLPSLALTLALILAGAPERPAR